MDRTYEITQLALRHRSASSIHHNRFCASPEIATTEKQFITEAISLNERLVECERKVKTAEMIVKNSSLFDSKHYQLQTITDSVDDEVRVIKRKWEELETGSWLLAAGIKDILQGKLSAVMKEFKSVLQVRSDTLHLLETRKGHLSLQTSSQVASLSTPTFLPVSTS